MLAYAHVRCINPFNRSSRPEHLQKQLVFPQRLLKGTLMGKIKTAERTYRSAKNLQLQCATQEKLNSITTAGNKKCCTQNGEHKKIVLKAIQQIFKKTAQCVLHSALKHAIFCTLMFFY
jgi:hypothetical protein